MSVHGTFPLGLVAPFAPNRTVNADSTAFFNSSGFTQRSSGVFFSAVMAGPMPAHPVTAGDPTYSATALESASAVIVNPAWSPRNAEWGHAIGAAERGWDSPTPHSRSKWGSCTGSVCDSKYLTAAVTLRL